MTFSAQLTRATLLPLLVAAAAACSDSTEPPRPTSLQAASTASQQAPAGAAVAERPSVVVRDQNGTPMPGVSVGFATIAGGGSVVPATVTSNANGVATVTSWTLGLSPGTNVVTATIGTAQVTFTAEGTPVPAFIDFMSAPYQVVPPGATLQGEPAVMVRDQTGQPLGAVTVTFTVTNGSSTVTPVTVVTGAQGTFDWGIARATSWHIPTMGTHTVTAAVPGLAPVTFTVNAETPVPTFLYPMSNPQQQVVAGTTLQGQPAVGVFDQTGQPMGGVTVTFTVTSGSSSVSPVTVVTGAQGTPDWGIARATSWQIPAVGTHTVTAAVPGVAPLTFTVNALDPAVCDPVGTVTVPGTIAGALSTGDCPLSLRSGEFVDFYVLEVTARSIVRFRAVSGVFDMYLILLTREGRPVAENDDDDTSLNSEMVAVLGPGTYHVGVTSFFPGETGPYTLTTEIAPEGGARGCLPLWFVMKGATVTGSLAPSQCEFRGRHIDLYVVFLEAGETAQITMSSTAVDAYLLLEGADFNLIENDNHASGTTDARITYTAPVSNFYLFGATSAQLAAGAYTLTID